MIAAGGPLRVKTLTMRTDRTDEARLRMMTERTPMSMSLTSSSFPDGGDIPQRHGKKIDNVSPELSWMGAPEETKSFALAFVDTHPIARGYVHWLVVDIDAATTSLPEGAGAGAMPPGSRELIPYAGPFPPSGTHAYELTVYALDTDTLALPANSHLEEFKARVKDHTLASAKIVGKFTKVT
jgi:Raf kinase inhibitor-like YbhB/YbcL family protein